MRVLTDELKSRALDVGFSAVRVAAATAFTRERDAFIGRVAAGLLDGMPWLTEARARIATEPDALMPGVRSILTVAMPYARPDHVWKGGPRGRIARYAWANDYHGVLKSRLEQLRTFLLESSPTDSAAVVVDTGRVVDRAVAVRAGLGWYGKSAMVLTREAGSWVMLGEILTTVPLEPDPPLSSSCGRCVRCLDLCPTGAIVAPGVVDSRRCVSYLTIEHRGWIPRHLRPLIGQWIFGCDVCQEVCPVNDRLGAAESADLAPVIDPEPELAPLLLMDQARFKERFHHTPVGRAGWVGFLRNVCVALGNCRDRASVAPLVTALWHSEPLVRGHAAWALGRIGGVEARAALEAARHTEQDPEVAEEISHALA